MFKKIMLVSVILGLFSTGLMAKESDFVTHLVNLNWYFCGLRGSRRMLGRFYERSAIGVFSKTLAAVAFFVGSYGALKDKADAHSNRMGFAMNLTHSMFIHVMGRLHLEMNQIGPP